MWRFLLPATVIALVALVAALGAGPARVSAAEAPSSDDVDILLAFDGTGSMKPAMAAARRDAVAAIASIKQLLPGAHFAVAGFRDFQSPAGEYELLQSMTTDQARVHAAVDRFKAVSTSGQPAGSTSAESYNLMFNRSREDPAIGWRTTARKVVVVLGDAEPYGAGRSGMKGCKSKAVDPHGLDTRTELAALRAAERTLIMIRYVSPATTASLGCYQAIAAAAYAGSAAAGAGGTNFGDVVVRLVSQAFIRLNIVADLGRIPLGATNGYTIMLTNPNPFPVVPRVLAADLPTGFTYVRGTTSGYRQANPTVQGRQLKWALDGWLQPGKSLALHFVVKSPRRVVRHPVVAAAEILTPGGRLYSASTSGKVVTTAAGRHQVWFNLAGRATAASVDGRGVVASSIARTSARGAVTVTGTRGWRLRLALRRVRGARVGAPTILRLQATVAEVRGVPGCRRGSAVSLDLHRSRRLLLHDGTATAERVILRSKTCSHVDRTWLNSTSVGTASAATARIAVAVR